MFIQYIGASIKIYCTGCKEKWNQQCGFSLKREAHAGLVVFHLRLFSCEKAQQQLLNISAFMYYFGRGSKELDAEFKSPQRAQPCQRKQEVTVVDVFVYVA